MQCFVRRHPLVLQVFDTAGEQTVELSQLIGHDGPVWQVTWAHPKFGSLLASCSLDHKVIVWKEAQEAQWVQVGGAHPAHLLTLCSCSACRHQQLHRISSAGGIRKLRVLLDAGLLLACSHCFSEWSSFCPS